MSWYNGLSLQNTTSTMNSKIVLNSVHDINTLGNVINSISLSGLLYGDWTEFTSSCMFYPYDLTHGRESTRYLIASGVSFPNISVNGLLNSKDEYGYNLGEYFYPSATSFLDFEPYTKCEIYLPYYGFTQIKIADVIGKYIQFRLYVDYSSGQAMYVISTSDTEIADNEDLPFLKAKYSNCRTISTLVFQLGYSIPISNANFNDTVRNIATMSVKTAATIGLGLVGSTISSGTEKSKMVVTERNPKTGRQNIERTLKNERSTSSKTYHRGSAVNSAIHGASTILSNIQASGSTDKPNNACVIGAISKDIVIIRTSAIPTIDVENDINYKHLVGLPYGECAILGELIGFTTVSDIHLEGMGFEQATSREMLELEEALLNGVILPNNGKIITFTIQSSDVTTTYQAVNGMTWGEWVESEYNTYGFVIVGDNIYANASFVSYNSDSNPVNVSDIITNNTPYYSVHYDGGSN